MVHKWSLLHNSGSINNEILQITSHKLQITGINKYLCIIKRKETSQVDFINYNSIDYSIFPKKL